MSFICHWFYSRIYLRMNILNTSSLWAKCSSMIHYNWILQQNMFSWQFILLQQWDFLDFGIVHFLSTSFTFSENRPFNRELWQHVHIDLCLGSQILRHMINVAYWFLLHFRCSKYSHSVYSMLLNILFNH